MIKLGIDVGNGFTKFKGDRFASRVKLGSLSALGNKRKEAHTVILNDKEYIVGVGGTFTGHDRYFTEEYKLALLTAIALSSGKRRKTIEANIVVGLPVDYHKSLSDKLEKHLKDLDIQEIKVDGTKYTIEIKNATVFLEGALPILEGDDSHMITIDVGAGTINVIEWEEQTIINKFTFNKAFYALNKDIAEFLNVKFGLDLLPEDAERYIGKSVIDTEDGETEVPELEEMVSNFIADIATTVRNNFHVKTCKKIKVLGGGAKNTFQFWQEQFKKAELVKDSQFINQKVYQAVAESIYEEE